MENGSTSEARIRDAVAEYPDPETGRGLGKNGQVLSVTLDGELAQVKIGLTTHSRPMWEEVREALEDRIRTLDASPATQVSVEIETFPRPPMQLGQIGLRAKSVVAVGSGKGGVGKSTIATALALGLQRSGCAVGLMDADVYGPSVPHLLGVSGRPQVSEEKKIVPAEASGLKMISMGLLVPPDEAVVWRGPMLHGAITQFLRDTDWGELDYLVIDMPPGTGDIALTLSQLLPLTGAVVVCTPQDVALLDAVKAIAMFRKVNIPVLGMVENMSGFECPDCGKRYDIFGKGGAREKAEELGVALLGEVPIRIAIRESGDAGAMSEVFEDRVSSQELERLGYQLVKQLATQHAAQPPATQLPVL